MTFADTSTPPGVRLYPHDPTSFLPLLRAHLPHSITTYSTIRTNPWPRVDVPPGVSLSASASSDANAGRATQEGATGQTDDRAAMPDSLLYGAVWATFPASQISNPPDVWAMLIHLPPPQRNQTRLYCSLDRELLVVPRPTAPGETPPRTLSPSNGAGSADDGSHRGLETGSKRWRAGQDLMLGVVQTVVTAFPPGEKYIPLNTVWVDGVVRWLEDVELASMVHDAYDVWLAPERLPHAGDTLQGEIRPGAGKEVDTTGLEVGPCRREDCEVVSAECLALSGMPHANSMLRIASPASGRSYNGAEGQSESRGRESHVILPDPRSKARGRSKKA